MPRMRSRRLGRNWKHVKVGLVRLLAHVIAGAVDWFKYVHASNDEPPA